jgi:hypothetical protein
MEASVGDAEHFGPAVATVKRGTARRRREIRDAAAA